MKLNQATDYAFRMVLHMALLPSGSKITGAVLAEQELIPERFLLKIMRSLIAAGIMKSFRGVDGGFALNRSPQEISLLDVIKMCIRDRPCNRNLAYTGLYPEYHETRETLWEAGGTTLQGETLIWTDSE